MKKVLAALFSLVLFSWAVSSCKKTEITTQEVTLNAVPSDLSFECEGGSAEISVTCNFEWSAASSESWCTVSPASGSKDGKIKVTVGENGDVEGRSATITITSSDKSARVTVTQKFKEAINVTKTSHEMGWEGGEIAVEVKSNIAYEVTIGESCEEWIHTAEAAKAMETGNAVIKVEPNTSSQPREGYVVIAAKGDPRKLATRVLISQEAKPATPVTEDFETYDAWAQAIEGWTFVDRDKAPAGWFNIDWCFFEYGVTPLSWFVFTDDFDAKAPSHSGKQHLAAIYNDNGTQNDDWLISPRLSGEAQTISFWAGAYTDRYGPESLELLYSKNDTDVESFTSVRVEEYSTDEWKETKFDIPEGAIYFAIRYISKNVAMVFVDDITYIPDPSAAPASVAKPCSAAARPANRQAAGFSHASIRKAGR